jgi:hypothetical protein
MARKRRNNNTNNINNSKINELENKIEKLELLNNLQSFSAPRGLLTNSSGIVSNLEDRDSIYIERQEMYNDSFVRELAKIIIVRAIGTTHDNNKPFTLSLKSNLELDKTLQEDIKQELEYIADLIDNILLDVTLDSQFFGDGYCKIDFEKGKGITNLITNITTKPFNITPIVTNKNNTLAYEVGNLYDKIKDKELYTIKNSRFYVAPHTIARINSKGNGTYKLTSEQITNINNHNVFANEELAYEDGIYGGILEDVYPDYLNFVWALDSLVNSRIGAGVIERFILQSLNSVSENERKELKEALQNQIKTTLSSLQERTNKKSPKLLIANHIIPTTQDGTNTISIQESNLNNTSFQSVDDIMIHIMKFLGAIGINIEMTSFGGMSMGGREKDGLNQNSLQADAQGTQIRKAIRDFIEHILKIHFLSKFGVDIDIKKTININFQSVLNQAKLTAEQQRLEAITNTQQVFGIIEQLKGMGLENNDSNKIMIKSILNDIISNGANDRDIMIESLVNIVFAKPQNQEEEI